MHVQELTATQGAVVAKLRLRELSVSWTLSHCAPTAAHDQLHVAARGFRSSHEEEGRTLDSTAAARGLLEHARGSVDEVKPTVDPTAAEYGTTTVVVLRLCTALLVQLECGESPPESYRPSNYYLV